MVELTLGGWRELAALRQPDRLTAANGHAPYSLVAAQAETSHDSGLPPLPHRQKPLPMYLIWTSVGNHTDADRIAADVVDRRLAACVQVEGPIVSHYRWQGRQERAEEFRLCFKCVPEGLPALEEYVFSVHPYEVPEWIAIPAERVGEKYLSWARVNSTTPPL